jgi:hypothetical protein
MQTLPLPRVRRRTPLRYDRVRNFAPIEPVEPRPPVEEPDEPSDLDDFDGPFTDNDDSRWDVFVPDDDQRDPLPEPGDFWVDEPNE